LEDPGAFSLHRVQCSFMLHYRPHLVNGYADVLQESEPEADTKEVKNQLQHSTPLSQIFRDEAPVTSGI
jgi:hypothetical protein